MLVGHRDQVAAIEQRCGEDDGTQDAGDRDMAVQRALLG